MKVFISWSGEASRQVALALRDWLPMVIQSVTPYVSSEDIDKGARWSSDISKELEDSQYGILCVTPQNIDAPWVNFEAGALSKSLEQSRVVPFLYQIDRTDVKGPLLQFQSTVFEKEDVRKLVKSINKASEGTGVEEARLDEIFEVWWPHLSDKLTGLSADTPASVPHTQRSLEDLATEILELVRGQQKVLFNPEQLLPIDYVEYVGRSLSRARRRTDVSRSAYLELDMAWDRLESYILSRDPDAQLIDMLQLVSRPMRYIVRRTLEDMRLPPDIREPRVVRARAEDRPPSERRSIDNPDE